MEFEISGFLVTENLNAFFLFPSESKTMDGLRVINKYSILMELRILAC